MRVVSRADGTTQNTAWMMHGIQKRERERNSWRRRYHHLTSGNEWEKTKNRNIKLKRNKSGSGYRFERGPSIYCIITRHPLRNTLCNVKHAKYIKDKKMFAFPPMLLVSLFLASSGWISASTHWSLGGLDPDFAVQFFIHSLNSRVYKNVILFALPNKNIPL